MHRSLTAAVLAAATLVSATPFAGAATALNLYLYAQNNNGVTSYSANALPMVFPGQAGFSFSTGTFGSQNQTITAVYADMGWNVQRVDQPTYASMRAELALPFHLTLDAGLDTQRDFTTSLDASGLPAAVSLPSFTGIRPNGTVAGARPTFHFTAPTGGYTLSFFRSDGPQVFTLDAVAVAAGEGSYTPSADMLDGSRYSLLLEREAQPAGFAFSTPIDQNDQALTDFGSFGTLTTRSFVSFVASVPEPTTVAFTAITGCALLGRKRRSYAKAS